MQCVVEQRGKEEEEEDDEDDESEDEDEDLSTVKAGLLEPCKLVRHRTCLLLSA